jgi:hypothetical protein
MPALTGVSLTEALSTETRHIPGGSRAADDPARPQVRPGTDRAYAYAAPDRSGRHDGCGHRDGRPSHTNSPGTPGGRDAGRQGRRAAGTPGWQGRQAGRDARPAGTPGRQGRQAGRDAGRQGRRAAGTPGGRDARPAGTPGGRDAGRQGRQAGKAPASDQSALAVPRQLMDAERKRGTMARYGRNECPCSL